MSDEMQSMSSAFGKLLADIEKHKGIKAHNWTPKEQAQYKCDCLNRETGDLHETDGYKCDICNNRGYIHFVEEQKWGGQTYYHEASRECKCMATRKSIRRMMRSGLKNVIKSYTFDRYKTDEPWQAKIKERAMAFCKDEDAKWFFIGGGVGAGKTHICTAICSYYLKNGVEVIYMLWRDEIRQLKANVNEDLYGEKVEKLKKVPVLYIDDFFKPTADEVGTLKPPTDADIQIAYEILNYRYNNPDLLTIISSERYISEIVDIDQATGSRIYEKTGEYKLNIKREKEKNYRLKEVEML